MDVKRGCAEMAVDYFNGDPFCRGCLAEAESNYRERQTRWTFNFLELFTRAS